MPQLGTGGDELPDFLAMTEAEIRVYAQEKADTAAEQQRELLRDVEMQLGSWSPDNVRRRVEAGILHAAGLLDDAAFAKRSEPVVIIGGLQITV